MFDILKQTLGSVLAFFYELLTPAFSPGWGYGVAIILLTIAINTVVFPLTLKQTRATRAFTEIQPEIRRIQKEYKDDPQEMQRRLLEVQKAAGATPGGCLLPLLIQMPIWFALFRVLQNPLGLDESGKLVSGAFHAISPESALGQLLLNEQPKFLGMLLGTTPGEALAASGVVTALPYLAMMALMVATQYVQQWHSTYGQDRPDQPGSGIQQALPKIMPLFIGVISYNFPAGLVLYWTTANLFRLGQQVLIFKIDGRPQPNGAKKEEAVDETETPKSIRPQQGAASKRRRRRRR